MHWSEGVSGPFHLGMTSKDIGLRILPRTGKTCHICTSKIQSLADFHKEYISWNGLLVRSLTAIEHTPITYERQ